MQDQPPTVTTDAKAARVRHARRLKSRARFDWRRAMFVLPNLFTLSSVFCGLYAMVLAAGGRGAPQYYQASLAIFFGIFFDMADGRVARLTKTQSDFGIQLDSLADVVTFGVAPAVLVYHWGLGRLGFAGAVVSFVYLACGALRLARFNVLAASGPGAKKYFVGLPIPLAAGVLVSLVMFHQTAFEPDSVRAPNVLVLVLVLAYLMVSNVRYRSFKDLRLSSKSLAVGFGLAVLFGVVAASIQPAFALLTFFCGYVLLGLIEEVVQYCRQRMSSCTPAGGTGPAITTGESASAPPDPQART